jgi:hypothetical protein
MLISGERLDVVANATAKETVGGFEVNGGVNRAGSFPGQLGVFQLESRLPGFNYKMTKMRERNLFVRRLTISALYFICNRI